MSLRPALGVFLPALPRQMADALFSEQRELVARFIQLEYEDRYDRMDPARLIDFIDTGSAAYHRDLFLRAGGFDESLSEMKTRSCRSGSPDREATCDSSPKQGSIIATPRRR